MSKNVSLVNSSAFESLLALPLQHSTRHCEKPVNNKKGMLLVLRPKPGIGLKTWSSLGLCGSQPAVFCAHLHTVGRACLGMLWGSPYTVTSGEDLFIVPFPNIIIRKVRIFFFLRQVSQCVPCIPSMILNFWCFCLYLSSAGITARKYHACFSQC